MEWIKTVVELLGVVTGLGRLYGRCKRWRARKRAERSAKEKPVRKEVKLSELQAQRRHKV
jgi:hypothetical protein